MFLAIDIGNSHSVYGFFKQGVLDKVFRISSNDGCSSDEIIAKISQLMLHYQISKHDVESIGISCVVPQLTLLYQQVCQKFFNQKPQFISDCISKLPLTINVENPLSIGADRICNCIAAKKKYNNSIIVVDIGTSTTFDIVDSYGNFIGGIIAPGAIDSAKTLVSGTAQLPWVEMTKPATYIGKNTHEALQIGLYYGFMSMLSGLLKQIKQELNFETTSIVTGGLINVFSDDLRKDFDHIAPYLTLEGIKESFCNA